VLQQIPLVVRRNQLHSLLPNRRGHSKGCDKPTGSYSQHSDLSSLFDLSALNFLPRYFAVCLVTYVHLWHTYGNDHKCMYKYGIKTCRLNRPLFKGLDHGSVGFPLVLLSWCKLTRHRVLWNGGGRSWQLGGQTFLFDLTVTVLVCAACMGCDQLPPCIVLTLICSAARGQKWNVWIGYLFRGQLYKETTTFRKPKLGEVDANCLQIWHQNIVNRAKHL